MGSVVSFRCVTGKQMFWWLYAVEKKICFMSWYTIKQSFKTWYRKDGISFGAQHLVDSIIILLWFCYRGSLSYFYYPCYVRQLSM